MRPKFSSVNPPTCNEPGICALKLYWKSEASEATSANDKKTAGSTNQAKYAGRRSLMLPPIGCPSARKRPAFSAGPLCPSARDQVFGEPLAPVAQKLRALLVVDDDGLFLPLLGRGEHSRQLGDSRIDFGLRS